MHYGYGQATYGTINYGFFWTLSGPAIKAYPIQVRYSNTTSGTLFDGSIFNGPVGVVGSIKNSCEGAAFGTTLGGVLRTWTPSGCVAYDSDSWDHESVVEVSWYVPGHSGRWWCYIKSPVAHSTDKQLYLFRADAGLSGDPWSAGWDLN